MPQPNIFTSKVARLQSEVWHYVLPVPHDVATAFIHGANRRVVCSISRMGKTIKFHCALMGSSEGYMVLLNAERKKKLGLVEGESVEVMLEKDTSEYGFPVSEEFLETLAQDEVAYRIFHQLTPGKQRTLIYYTDNVKSSEIKIRRALVVSRHLVETGGDLDYKVLNERMKQANREASRKN